MGKRKMRSSAGKWKERAKAEMRITKRKSPGKNDGKWSSEKGNRGGNAKNLRGIGAAADTEEATYPIIGSKNLRCVLFLKY